MSMYPLAHLFFPFFGFGFGSALYFLPSIIAFARSKRDLLAIFLLNFFLGCSVIRWIVALLWAAKNDVAAGVRQVRPWDLQARSDGGRAGNHPACGAPFPPA